MSNHAMQPSSGSHEPVSAPDRRRDDRFTADEAMTALGAMIDISRSGLSVLAEQAPPLNPGDRFRIEVRHEDRVALFPAELVYADRRAAERLLGIDRTQGVKLGLKFGKLTPAQQREVQRIMDAGVKIPHLEIAWDIASLQSDADEPDTGEEDVPQDNPVVEKADAEPSEVAAGSKDRGDQPTDEPIDQHEETIVLAGEPQTLPSTSASDETENAFDQLERLADESAALADFAESAERTNPKREACPHAELPQDVASNTNDGDDEDGPSPVWARTLQPVDARPAQPGDVNQRRAGRILADDATTSLGKIVDMSAGGMCVQRKGAAPVRVGSQFMIDLHLAGRVLRAPVEVMRIQKVGWRTFEYGLKFGDWPDDIRAEFGRLVRMASKATNYR